LEEHCGIPIGDPIGKSSISSGILAILLPFVQAISQSTVWKECAGAASIYFE
jgi:hypothetical protein